MGENIMDEKKNIKKNDVGPLGFNFKNAMMGNAEKGHPKTLPNRKKSGFDKEFGERLRKSTLGD
jgi:hypothetical protein